LMLTDLERRLARAEISAAILWVDRQSACHRQSLCCAELHELVRERFRVTGINPALAEALRRGEEAAAELAAIQIHPT
jgi:hypothetical protein